MTRRTPVRKKRLGGPRRGPADIPLDRWRNPGYLRFLRREGRCCACWAQAQANRTSDGYIAVGSGYYDCDPAHGPVNGHSQKGPDAEAIPLCRTCHNVQTLMGWRNFENRYGFSRETEAAEWFKLYRKVSGNHADHLAGTPEYEYE